MTKEYIERGALMEQVKAIHRSVNTADINLDYDTGFHSATSQIQGVIASIPAADVVEVKHGEWDDTGRYKFPGGSVAVRCSECGCCLTAGEYRMNVWNYCPVCGARMDGGADNG